MKCRMLKDSIALVLKLSGLMKEKCQLIIHQHPQSSASQKHFEYIQVELYCKLGAKLFGKPMPGTCAVLISSNGILRI